MKACIICEETDAGILNAATLTTEPLDQLNTAIGIMLQHVCATCNCRRSTATQGQSGPVREWASKRAA